MQGLFQAATSFSLSWALYWTPCGRFYSHAETSYAPKSFPETSDYLTAEICAVLDAVKIARANLPASKIPPLVLSVGSTPTAYAFSREALASLQSRLDEAAGPSDA